MYIKFKKKKIPFNIYLINKIIIIVNLSHITNSLKNFKINKNL